MLETLEKNPLDAAQAALQESPVFALRTLGVEQVGNNLILSGTVSTFYYKQLAQEVIRSAANGLGVINGVDVSESSLRRRPRSVDDPVHAN
jgi:hypothetical protein